MTQPERLNHAYPPRQAAVRFLSAAFPQDYIPRLGPREIDPPLNINNSAILNLHHMNDEHITQGDKVRFLANKPVTIVALIVADIETGLTSAQERYALYTSAASLRFQVEAEIMRYETDKKWQYRNLDFLRTSGKRVGGNSAYLQEKKEDLEKLKKLQQELVEVSTPTANKER